jgi:hypothetical protein
MRIAASLLQWIISKEFLSRVSKLFSKGNSRKGGDIPAGMAWRTHWFTHLFGNFF